MDVLRKAFAVVHTSDDPGARDLACATMNRVSREDFESPGKTVQIGLPPFRIDVVTEIDGVDFADAWASRVEILLEGRSVHVIGRDALIRNKRATGRLLDLADVEALEKPSDD